MHQLFAGGGAASPDLPTPMPTWSTLRELQQQRELQWKHLGEADRAAYRQLGALLDLYDPDVVFATIVDIFGDALAVTALDYRPAHRGNVEDLSLSTHQTSNGGPTAVDPEVAALSGAVVPPTIVGGVTAIAADACLHFPAFLSHRGQAELRAFLADAGIMATIGLPDEAAAAAALRESVVAIGADGLPKSANVDQLVTEMVQSIMTSAVRRADVATTNPATRAARVPTAAVVHVPRTNKACSAALARAHQVHNDCVEFLASCGATRLEALLATYTDQQQRLTGAIGMGPSAAQQQQQATRGVDSGLTLHECVMHEVRVSAQAVQLQKVLGALSNR
jgi:hypothetical protein